MLLIDAVNLILPKLGEHQVTGLNIKHPTLAIILPEIDEVRQEVLIEGWWFNEFHYTAHPNNEGEIFMGTEVLSFIPDEAPAVMRRRRLYNSETRGYTWDGPVSGRIREDVPFEAIPENAARAVLYSALVSIYATDIGMTDVVQMWNQRAQASYSALMAEHLRHRKYSTRKSRRFRRIRSALRGS